MRGREKADLHQVIRTAKHKQLLMFLHKFDFIMRKRILNMIYLE
ncbi:hypothetical protein HMPREF1348_01301 [Enterococcus faecium 505]|uniref:Uncharacterized protein n=1 Tax=Enterococcus faecium 505 TaxID=1134806 RepID=J6K9H6_ENTFC|nr:hypothetical protein HMPREF1348_01301 [Enterococcus faecium 505]